MGVVQRKLASLHDDESSEQPDSFSSCSLLLSLLVLHTPPTKAFCFRLRSNPTSQPTSLVMEISTPAIVSSRFERSFPFFCGLVRRIRKFLQADDNDEI